MDVFNSMRCSLCPGRPPRGAARSLERWQEVLVWSLVVLLVWGFWMWVYG